MKIVNRHTFRKVVAETNIFDVAIGLAMAGVFIKLVNAFVIYILTPIVGMLIRGKNLANFELNIIATPGHEPVVFRYGMFLDALIEFLLVAIVIYWSARLVLRIKKKGTADINNQHTKICNCCHMSIPLKALKCPYCQHEYTQKKD